MFVPRVLNWTCLLPVFSVVCLRRDGRGWPGGGKAEQRCSGCGLPSEREGNGSHEGMEWDGSEEGMEQG